MIFSAEDLRLTIETCSAVVHYRSDLTRIFVAAGVPRTILQSLPAPANPDWGHTKREVADHVVMSLAAMPDGAGLGPLRRIVAQVADWHNFATAKDPERARSLVRQLSAEIQLQSERRQFIEQVGKVQTLPVATMLGSRSKEYTAKVKELHDEFLDLMPWPATRAAQRGYRFQDFVYELFEAAGLRPGRPYRRPGQEIDGSFVLDFENYLLEARWQKNPVAFRDVSAFAGKVERKIECTRGVFIAVSGFSSSGIEASGQGKRPNIVLVDGVHLMHVLGGHVHLVNLLRAMLEAAATRGTIYTRLVELRF